MFVIFIHLAVKVWTEYCQYVMDNMEGQEGIDDARAVFEKAITSVGLHLTEVNFMADVNIF